MYKQTEPFVTPKYPISVPTDLYYSTPCVFKLTLGSKFYIGKAKSLPQTMAQIAVQVERYLRTGSNPEGWYHHVIAYIKKNRVMKAVVERCHDEMKDSTWELLQLEHNLLVHHRNNPDCLNNNWDVYIPKWISPDQVQLFNQWKNDTDKANRNKHRATNSRKKHKGGQLAVRSKRRVSPAVRQKSVGKKRTGKAPANAKRVVAKKTSTRAKPKPKKATGKV